MAVSYFGGGNRGIRSAASHWQTLSHNVESNIFRHAWARFEITTLMVIGINLTTTRSRRPHQCYVSWESEKKTRTKYPNIYMNMRYSFMHRKDTKGVIRSHNSMKNKQDNVKRKVKKRQTMLNKIQEPNTHWDRYQGAGK